MEERYISAQSALQRPKDALVEWKQSLNFAFPLGWQLAKRDIQARYRQTLLGYLWAVLPAIGAAVAFSLMKSANILNTGETSIPYPIYVFIGTLFWQLFSTSLSRPIELVQGNKSVLSKMQFPRVSLLIAAMLLVLYDTLIKLCLLPIVFFAFDSWPNTDLMYLPLVIITFVLLGSAIGIMLCPLNMIFNDIKIVVPITMTILVLLSPVGYVAPKSGWLKFVVDYNPLTHLLDAARGTLTTMPMPELASWGIIGLISAVFLALAVVFYLVSMPIVVERQSA